MRVNDYRLIDPRTTGVGEEFRAFARVHPFAAERLWRCLEDFVQADTEHSCKILERNGEFYLVPPRFVLAHVPDAAAVIRVIHRTRQLEIVEIISEYGGYDEPAQWENLKSKY